MAFLPQAVGYLSYFFNAVNEHSLHTPFLYELYTKVIKSSHLNGDYSEIEALHKQLLKDKHNISLTEFGAGSSVNTNNKRSIGDIARNSLTSPKYSALFYRLIKYFNVRNIVELGTSFGINSLYLAKYEATNVYTFEGCTNTANIAKTNFEKVGATNIKVIEGNIDKTLSSFFDGSIKPDMVYMDANHRYAPTLQYFELILKNNHNNTIVIIDDIHWSEEMSKAWKEICNHPEVTLSLDLNRCGILFFKNDLSKQHFYLTF
ncbi:MAG: class I SAM-dependent methyltransferase [Cyclobacteriaceae bacterium]|nr:class I SAM-dependent methyltransferase [Cyclobacteriaceae bacterium]